MSKVYGYCRVSTKKQSMARQIANIVKEFPNADISYQDEFTGTTSNRPAWQSLLKRVSNGDTIVFDSVSRMSRNAEEGIGTYFELYTRGVNLVFIKEHYIDTTTYDQAKNNAVPMTGTAVDCILQGVNEYLRVLAKEQIKIAFDQAEKEVSDLQQRTKEGMAAKGAGLKISAGRQGKHYGTNKAKHAKEIIRKASKDFGGSMSDADIMKTLNISRNSYYKYKAELKIDA